MPDVEETAETWNVLLVEDEEVTCSQIKEFFSDEVFESRKLAFQEIKDWDEALRLIRERKADLVILDIYRGRAAAGGERVGEEVLRRIVTSGFVSVIIHTNLPEGLEELTNEFIRLVPKGAGLPTLKREIQQILNTRMPLVHRAIINRLDSILRDYIWKFVQPNWATFAPLANKPEFLRLIVQRLAITLAREGIEEMTTEVFGAQAVMGASDPENVHPAEYYIKPSIGSDPLLGDIRIRESAGDPQYIVVLWPSCDMVSTRGRTPKTDLVLCARASLLNNTDEMREWIENHSETKKKMLISLMKNDRHKSPERYHYLPGVWDIPDLIVDFQSLEHLYLTDIRNFQCVATVASPFAEALAARFVRYVGRLGTPDLDWADLVARLRGPVEPNS